MTRVRTLQEAYKELRAADPNCGLTKTALRRLVVDGKIQSSRVGCKYLVNMDALERYLSGGVDA